MVFSMGAFPVLLALGAFAPAAAPPTEVVQREVEAVFSDPAFQTGLQTTHGGPQALLAMIFQEIRHLLLKLLRVLDQLHAENSAVFWTIFIVLAIILVLILIHIGWSLSLAFRGLPRSDRSAEDSPAERRRRYRDLRSEARRLAEEGRCREAVRFLLLALLSLLEERRILTVASGWTNREILARLRFRSAVSRELAAFRDRVETASYSGAALSLNDFQECDTTLEHLTLHLEVKAP